MKNECNIIRDILPLYAEDMVSEDTAEFVKEHIEKCADCRLEFEALKPNGKIDNVKYEQIQNDTGALIALKKKLRKKKWIAISITAVCLIAIVILLHLFPVYRVAQVGGTSYYKGSELAKLVYIGSASDRAQAQSVLRLADKAFHDTRHTRAENEEEYGLLARYATATDRYSDVSFNEHSLELWSAHLEEDEGWIWVYYSSETFRHDGSTAHGSWKVPSLWKVEKNDIGEWVVVQIREHP